VAETEGEEAEVTSKCYGTKIRLLH